MINDHAVRAKKPESQMLSNKIQEWLAKGNEIKQVPVEASAYNYLQYGYNSRNSRLAKKQEIN